MKKNILWFVIGVLFMLTALFVTSGIVQATNGRCPKGKTCYWAEHRQTHKRACRHNANPPWQWVLPKTRCGEQDPPPPPADATNTPRPQATSTSRPDPRPSQTPIVDPPAPATSMPTNDDPGNEPAVTAAATLQPFAVSGDACLDDCDFRSTQAAAISTIAAAQATQAAATANDHD